MAISTWPGETVGGQCGGPSTCSLIKLEDVPDLNYFVVCLIKKIKKIIFLFFKERQKRRSFNQRAVSHQWIF